MTHETTSSSPFRRLIGPVGVILLYVFCAIAYAWALFYTSQTDFLYNLERSALDYLVKGILTIPIWWLIFKGMRDFPTWQRYGIHILLLPFWVFAWIKTYYFVCEYLDIGHLGGAGVGWDIYIPTLFYILQFAIFHIYDEIRRLAAQEKHAMELREIALRSELTALKAQLNPHFLYNVFNTINASIPPKNESTRELIAQLSDLFRYQLKASREITVPLADELEFIRNYLELEKARFEERLNIEWQVDEKLLQVPVPPMLLQPLVENAIRHGISPRIEGGTVRIMVVDLGEEIEVSIIDDGVGFKPNAKGLGTGVGLDNTRKMLDRLYGRPLQVTPALPHGTMVQFKLPRPEVLPVPVTPKAV